MKATILLHQTFRNIFVFCAWTVTSFIGHYTANKFLSLVAHTKVGQGQGHDVDDLTIESFLSRFFHAGLQTLVQLCFCAILVDIDTCNKNDGNVRRTKIYHALATLGTNSSMAFTFASSTFAIKMMEPITSGIVQYFLSGMPLSPLAVFSLPLIVGGAMAFADTPLNVSNNYVGVAAALASNVILALRNIAIKQLTQGREDKTPTPLSPTLRLPIPAVAILLSVFIYLNFTPETPLLSSSHLLTLLNITLSGVFHVVYSFISTGLVLTQISVVSHAVVNILKRLLVIILLHALGTRVATFHNFLGLAVCTMGLLLYGWDKSRHIHGVNTNHGKDSVLTSTVNKAMKVVSIFGLVGFITVFSIHMQHPTKWTDFVVREHHHANSTLSLHTVRHSNNRSMGIPYENAPIFDSRGTFPKSFFHNITYITNLPLINQNPEDSNQQSQNLTTSDEIIRESQRLHFTILGKELRKFKYAMLFDVAAFENKGDPCITAGEIYFLARINVKLIYYCNYWKCGPMNLVKAKVMSYKYSPDDLAILIHGGGNIVGYKSNDELRFKILGLFSRFKIFVFPQSIWIRDANSSHVNKTIQNYCCHPNLSIVLRDSLSYKMANQMYKGSTRLLMAPDMAFQIGPVPRFMSPVYDILWLKRSDSESPGYSIPYSIPSHLRVHVSDWWKWTTPNAASNLERAFLMATNGFFYLQRGRVIITDRLHGHILSTLMDIPHVLIDNKAKKLSSYHKTWTSSLSNVVVTDDPTKALDLAIGLLEKFDKTLPPVIPFLNLNEDFKSVKLGVPDIKYP